MTTPAVDHDRLAALAADLGDEQLVRDAVALYLDELPARLDAVRRSVAVGDADAVRSAAHALASPSAMLGADAMAEAARALEASPSGGSEAALAEAIVLSATGTERGFRDYLAT